MLNSKRETLKKIFQLNHNSVDAVISNCVINLTTNKTNAFKEVFRILKNGWKDGDI